MRKGGVILLAVVLAAGAVWWLESGGLEPSGPVDPYAPDPSLDDAGPGLQGREVTGSRPQPTRPVPGDPPPDDGSGDAGGIVLVGRVVDARRRPVANARVEGRFPDRSMSEVRTDDQGRFRLGVGARPTRFVVGTLRALTTDGRLGVGPVSLQAQGGAAQAVSAIVVGEAYALDVRIQRAGASVEGARVVVAQQIWSRMTPIADGRTDADGGFRAVGVPRGPVRVFAALAGHGRNHMGLHLPRSEGEPVLLELLDERALTVRVIDKVTRVPVEGAHVHVGDRYSVRTGDVLRLLPEAEAPPTDADGLTRVTTLNRRDAYFVNAEAEGYAPPSVVSGLHTTVPDDAVEVTCELGTFRTLSFPIAVGEIPPPADGTPLELETMAWLKPAFEAQAAARIEGGRLIVRGLPAGWANGRVVTPEGAFATFAVPRGDAQPEAVAFQRGLELRVRIVERGRGPLANARLTWRGGLQFGERQEVRTDGDGEALLRGMSAGRIAVILLSAGEAWQGVSAGTIELTPGNADQVHVLEVEPLHTLTIEVVVDGQPGLPAAYQLDIGQQGVASADVEEDPDAGVLRVRTRASGSRRPVPVQLRARGYTTGTALRRSDGDERVSIALSAAARLVVRVVPPEDGDFSLSVERFHPEADRWGVARASRADGNAGAGGGRQEASERVFLVAEAGRFRVRDAQSDTYSDPVDLALGYEAETALDLSQAAWVRVQVEPADAPDITRARVFRTDVAPDHVMGRNRGAPVDGRGRAKVRARRGERVSLSVRHPLLSAAQEGGVATVSAGSTKQVALKLEQGSLITFRLASQDVDAKRAANVVLAPDGELGSPNAFQGITVLDQGRHRLGGFEPGVYTIWIDAFRGAPIVLEGRELGDGTTDLGLLTQPPGASLRAKVLADAGASTPILWIVARRKGAPSFSRGGNRPKGSTDDILIHGLPAGTYEVSMRTLGTASASVPEPQTAVLGAAGEAGVTFDLRTGSR